MAVRSPASCSLNSIRMKAYGNRSCYRSSPPAAWRFGPCCVLTTSSWPYCLATWRTSIIRCCSKSRAVMAADEAGDGMRNAGHLQGKPPARRVVLLGASNLTRGISTVVETSAKVWGRPIDVVAALGHGRSYGMDSTVLGRTLPGILQCGLWQALQQRPQAQTAALVTDIGIDLFYGAAGEQVADWVEQCLDRLARYEAKIIITRLPVCNLPHNRTWQYAIVRSVLIPSCRLPLEENPERACDLDDRINRMARERNCTLLEPRAEWYGFDPIHVKLRHW